MNYRSALEYLYNRLPAYHRIGKAAYKNNLDNTLALDEYFNHPHRAYRTIHIAGTNGKGSVSHLIASVLQEAGYKTGLFTSPHLKDFRERIRVNGRMIPKRAVIDFVVDHRNITETLQPSFFELTAAMAFNYFFNTDVDVAVIETGLGGRLDSTNIITPVLSVITNIGHDHMDLLGGTLEKVAGEKAGIIKKNIPVVVGESQPETKNIFLKKAMGSGSEIYFADEVYYCTLADLSDNPGLRKFIIRKPEEKEEITGFIPLGGDYQTRNIQTLFQSCDVLKGTFAINTATIINGVRHVIKNTRLSGRWQILRRRPLVICDTGHNKEGIEYVVGQIKKMRADNIHFVLGFVNDKDLSHILPLFPDNAKYYFTRASVLRALDENLLQKEALLYGLKGNTFPSVREALKAALRHALPSDLVFVGGSTFVVAEVL